MKLWLIALTLASAPAFAQNMKFYASDTKLSCVKGSFQLNVKFDGTGDSIEYTWNDQSDTLPDQSGTSPVFWKNDVATFQLANAENGPFTLTFRNRQFYFLNVPCTELH